MQGWFLASTVAVAVSQFWGPSCSARDEDDSTDTTAAAEIGDVCSTDDDCQGIHDGTCAGAGVCSAPCAIHSDCGCPAGTTDGDILDGRCDVACVEDACARVCTSGLECAGNTACEPTLTFSACLN
jgi:hypothetical protein